MNKRTTIIAGIVAAAFVALLAYFYFGLWRAGESLGEKKSTAADEGKSVQISTSSKTKTACTNGGCAVAGTEVKEEKHVASPHAVVADSGMVDRADEELRTARMKERDRRIAERRARMKAERAARRRKHHSDESKTVSEAESGGVSGREASETEKRLEEQKERRRIRKEAIRRRTEYEESLGENRRERYRRRPIGYWERRIRKEEARRDNPIEERHGKLDADRQDKKEKTKEKGTK